MIAYASRTGNVRYIVQKLNLPAIEITKDTVIETPFILCTYTDGLGDVPAVVQAFMEQNATLCKGIVVSGNSNFGLDVFGLAGDKLASDYHIPLVRKIDLRGFSKDYEAILAFYNDCVKEDDYETILEVK
ncbi:class Ib ribonucleoside-diphosphate reductase assembly flavoprotein NrdI [Lysinibacillus sp. 54212]|uniref:class Ib ribonucleoside-diphosphate reductase assembly flavoprotein NrdI n=1 Tax=Lysinibacillus sp. 54212 TaxID=3119829 RepID=UPI002FC7B80B